MEHIVSMRSWQFLVPFGIDEATSKNWLDSDAEEFVVEYRFEMQSPVGDLRLFSSGDELTGLYFEGHSPAPKDTSGKIDAAPFAEVQHQLEQYFANERDEFDLPIRLDGTVFQEQVWDALQSISFGDTMSYAEIAHACARPRAARAVGAAVGRNPISIVVPCHRVVGSSGWLIGFAGGLKRKQWLLEREGASVVR